MSNENVTTTGRRAGLSPQPDDNSNRRALPEPIAIPHELRYYRTYLAAVDESSKAVATLVAQRAEIAKRGPSVEAPYVAVLNDALVAARDAGADPWTLEPLVTAVARAEERGTDWLAKIDRRLVERREQLRLEEIELKASKPAAEAAETHMNRQHRAFVARGTAFGD